MPLAIWVPKRSHVVSLIPKSRGSASVRYLLRLYLVHFSSAPLVLYSNFVPRVTLSLSGKNSIGDEGAKALSAALKDSRLETLCLGKLSAAAILGALHERPGSALRCFRR
jgi:hypothetical protein